MFDIDSGFVHVNNIRLHFYRTGGNKPPIILSHGLADNGLCWIPVVNKLMKTFDLIMVDARGHGLSDISPTNYSVDTMTNDLAELIQELDLEKPALIGHSMGAQITAHLAALHPSLVSCSILEDPGFGIKFNLPRFILARVFKLMYKRMLVNPAKNLSKEELKEKCRKENPTWSEEEIHPWAVSKKQFGQNEPERILNSLIDSFQMDWKDIVRKIKSPFLLLISDKGMTSQKAALEVSQLNARGKWVQISNAGHNIRRENFNDFMKAVLDFLSK
jgi:pimeloyl-ACP methyl ester carboxylesterase